MQIDLSGSTEISGEGIKKHFKNIEPHSALFELAWNGFDAKAMEVHISIEETEMHGIDSSSVFDNGDGIDFSNNLNDNFGKFNDSEKKEDAASHGSHGRGRLAFHRLCNDATWHTKSTIGQARISISSGNIKKFEAFTIEDDAQHAALAGIPSGTYVQLSNFNENLPPIEKLRDHFATEFGWFLALNPTKSILINDVSIVVPENEIYEDRTEIAGHQFDVKIIRWENQPTSEKSYIYLLGSEGKTLHKQLSTFNKKANFFTSIYVKSPWADDFVQEGDRLFSDSKHTADSDEWRAAVKFSSDAASKVYEKFLREYVDNEIEKYVADGIFPTYRGVDPQHAEWRLNNTKEIVRLVYLADPSVFNSLNKKQRKILIRLLDRIAVSNENDSLFEVLDSVLELDSDTVALLENQLKRTTLEHIVSTIEALRQRQDAVAKMRELMNVHYNDVLETPDLQGIIENNTWLFGHRYETIGAEEDTFAKIARGLRATFKGIDDIELSDLESGATIEGAQRQSDLFLTRKIPSTDSLGRKIFRCIIIEIKRPGIALNKKHLRQLNDYAEIISKHPEFSSELMRFELVLIGRKISAEDVQITAQLKGQIGRGEMGLVSDDDRIKQYVLNWYTLLDGFDLSHDFLISQLQMKRDSLSHLSKDELVADLQGVAA